MRGGSDRGRVEIRRLVLAAFRLRLVKGRYADVVEEGCEVGNSGPQVRRAVPEVATERDGDPGDDATRYSCQRVGSTVP